MLIKKLILLNSYLTRNAENNMKLLCPHNTFESLTLTNERGRTVQYMCSKCKMWFTPREHKQIQKLKDSNYEISSKI